MLWYKLVVGCSVDVALCCYVMWVSCCYLGSGWYFMLGLLGWVLVVGICWGVINPRVAHVVGMVLWGMVWLLFGVLGWACIGSVGWLVWGLLSLIEFGWIYWSRMGYLTQPLRRPNQPRRRVLYYRGTQCND